METKRCGTCKEYKSYAEFSKNKSTFDGLQSRCKECVNSHARDVSDNTKIYKKLYRERNREFLNAQDAAYYKNNKEAHSRKAKEYRDKNSEYLKSKSKEYYNKNKDVIKEKSKTYAINNRDKIREYARQYNANLRKTDPMYSLKTRMRKSIRRAAKLWNFKNKASIESTLGCSCEFFKNYIESQFTEGMSWDRFNEIHIDHIKPLSSAKDEQEVIKLNHFSNLQPLWEIDNLTKFDSIPPQETINMVNMIYECSKSIP